MGIANRLFEFMPEVGKAVISRMIYRIPAEQWIRWQWWFRFRRQLNLQNPQTYNERLQWLKIYGEDRPDVFGDVTLARKCADKVRVRDYVSQLIGPQYLVPVLGIYHRLRDIPVDDLPDSFVVKANHDSGSVVIVKEKRHFSLNGPLGRKLKNLEFRLTVDFSRLMKEWVYSGIVPVVLVEELLAPSHRTDLWDYKVFVFRGEPRLIQVDIDRFGEHKQSYYTPEWKKTDMALRNTWYDGEVPKPPFLEPMLEFSSVLAKPFRHARVDWYGLGDRLMFGEITFFHQSGFAAFCDQRWNLEMGRWLAW